MSDGSYNHQKIEKKWQDFWLENKTFKTVLDTSKPKYYCLDMFPYPSGDGLHVGHPEGYTATDIVSRYKRMKGFNVLHPMGWDAFGLPAERHAVRTGEHPAIITNKNCDNFRKQIQALGLSYDWDREINTTDPNYYKWTQWIFKVLYERGLAYEVEAPVNWCPALATVLANEEVKDGKYVETGDPVEKRAMRQWMLKITEYAERLLQDLDELDWPEGIKAMQREWIGKSTGADVDFMIVGTGDVFTVFTTRPDTLFGATYCVFAPDHPLVKIITKDAQRAEVEAYVAATAKKSAQDRMRDDKEKTGVFTGALAINPVNGKDVPIWISDYVLADYGYGAIMAVPGHDTRDYEFAKTFGLPIVEVIAGGDITKEAFTGNGTLVNSSFIDGLDVPTAKQTMIEWLDEQGIGKGTVNYKLRDWLFSRQRYWGEPFPLIHLEDGSIKTIPMTDLPLTLPELDEYKPTADGAPPLARATEWVNTTDSETGLPAMRETNTMPQWAGSCWYFLRYCDPTNSEAAWSKEAEEYWMPVDLYVGGAEHAVLHLLYSRFWHKVLYDAGYVHTKEPFQKLFNQGMILAYSYQDNMGKYYYPPSNPKTSIKSVIESKVVNGRKVTVEFFVDKATGQAVATSKTGERIYVGRDGDPKNFWIEEELARHDPNKLINFSHPNDDPAVTLQEIPHRIVSQVEKMSTSRYNVENSDDAYSYKDNMGKHYYPPSNPKSSIKSVTKSKDVNGRTVTVEFFVDEATGQAVATSKTSERVYVGRDGDPEKFWIEEELAPHDPNKPINFSHPNDDPTVTLQEIPFRQEISHRIETQVEKMSKSRYNVVNPDDVVQAYGADSMRLYEMFMGPLDRDKPWTEEGVQGVHRFLKRAWSLFIDTETGAVHSRIVERGGDPALAKELHKTIKAVSHDIEGLLFNTAIARMMEFVNAAMKAESVDRAVMEPFILVLAPFAPHMAEEIWQRLGHTDTLAYAAWPQWDESLLVEDTIELPVQINGKSRGTIVVPAGADKDTILAAAKAEPKIQSQLEGKTVVKEIYVPGKIVNLVVK